MLLFTLGGADLMALFPDGRGMLWCEGGWYPNNGSRALAREALERGKAKRLDAAVESFLAAQNIPMPALPTVTFIEGPWPSIQGRPADRELELRAERRRT